MKETYEQYKEHWFREHVAMGDITLDTILDFATSYAKDNKGCDAKDFLEEHGFNGSLYACEAERITLPQPSCKKKPRKETYEQYKERWFCEHVAMGDITLDTILDFATSYAEDNEGCDVKDFLEEHGFNGSLYACEAEWEDEKSAYMPSSPYMSL